MGANILTEMFQNMLTASVKKSVVNEDTSVHTLRHSFTTHFLIKGVALRKVQGNRNIRLPEATGKYNFITDEMKKDIKNRLDNLDFIEK